MCGASLTVTPEATREERKVVTVLFCDLVGFTAKAEKLDPEEVRAVLRPYHDRVRAELERHGGTVEKFIGDAVMALFGAPTTHEDDPERAVRAALAIRDFAVEEELELRVGVTTGEALVSLGASASEGEGMASGDVVNTAARLQSAAPVNGILTDETTYRATRTAIEFVEAPAVDAKGKAEPIAVWEATAAHSRFGVDVTHHARAELVGREQELGFLRDAFLRSRATRTPQLVTLVAVPGMGKSRLVHELMRIVDADEQLVTWRQGRCLAYGDGVAFWALAEAVKAQAGIADRDTEAEAAEKVHSAVADAIDEAADARWVESHLRPLVGLEADTGLGGDRRGEAFAAWRRFLEALAELRPLVLVFEDLHWADDGFLDFVDELVDWLSGVPLLVVCSARPELLERRPGWGGGKLNASTIGLSPLTSEQTALLISHVLERSVLPAETQRALLERAEGNPLYAEQFAELYAERGATDELALPETLQGIVAARLDGLSREEKGALQDASVMGKVFWAASLQGAPDEIEPRLRSLERKGFLIRQRRSSLEGESEWSFSHMLLRDVAYSQIPRAERGEKHRRAAEWIEGLGRPEDHSELLAHHWRSALELGEAAGGDTAEIVGPARQAFREAGDRAYSVNAYLAAARYYDEALALWPEDDRERPRLLYQNADALYLADDERALGALEEARDALLGVGDEERAAEAELSLSRIWWHRGQGEETRSHETRAEELVGGLATAAAARVLAFIARTRTIGGDPEQGLRLASAALEKAEALGIDELYAHALATIGIAKRFLGDPTGARDEERALELAVAANSPIAGAIANNVGVVAWLDFDLAKTGELWEDGLRIAERFGDASGVRWLRGQLAAWTMWIGSWDDALTRLDEFIAECEAAPHYLEATTRVARARIREGRGDPGGALSEYRRALALARSTGDPQELLPALGAAVLAFETHGAQDEVGRLAEEVVEIARNHRHEAAWILPLDFLLSDAAFQFERELREVLHDAPLPPWRELSLACLDREFVRVADRWAEGGMTTWAALCRLRAAEELFETGRRAEGEVQARQALAFYRTVGATYYVTRCDALLSRAESA